MFGMHVLTTPTPESPLEARNNTGTEGGNPKTYMRGLKAPINHKVSLCPTTCKWTGEIPRRKIVSITLLSASMILGGRVCWRQMDSWTCLRMAIFPPPTKQLKCMVCPIQISSERGSETGILKKGATLSSLTPGTLMDQLLDGPSLFYKSNPLKLRDLWVSLQILNGKDHALLFTNLASP